jgi:ribose transport system ATP-binding protein
MSAGREMPAALEVADLTKRFGRTTALDAVSLTVAPAEIHALLGHNGSGKSTMVKLLSGYHRPDAGEIRFGGQEPGHPITQTTLRELGVGFVHQDIGLVPAATVLENLLIGRFTTGSVGQIRWKADRMRLRTLLDSFELDIAPDDHVASLSATQRTLIGLLRAFQDIEGRESGLLVLDEVTASLPAEELDRVFAAVRSIRRRGIAVLLVTHHLNEPLVLADRVSALRDGRLVASEPIGGQTEHDLAEMVLGEERRIGTSRPNRPAPRDVVLDAQSVTGAVVDDVSIQVHAGEVVGFTGLAGSGHDELPYLLYGSRKATIGRLTVGSTTLARPSPNASRAAGVAMVSGDRARAGGVLPATLAENLSAPVLNALGGPLGSISARKERSLVTDLVRRFDIRPGEPSMVFSALSGGNQQKALLGRWMAHPPALLLLDEPTSGVDIGAVDSILATLDSYVREGGAIVIASTQYEDLSRIADRVLVFARGRIVDEISGEAVTPKALLTKSYTSPVDTTTAVA